VELTPAEADIEVVRTLLSDGEIGWICFFSPSGVVRFCELFGSEHARRAKVAAIGNTTASKARRAGLNVRFVSTRANGEAFAISLIEYTDSV
jgi:uroporphyrinogen-III synthase